MQGRDVSVIIIVIVLVVLLFGLMGSGMMLGGRMMGGYGYGYGSWGIFMGLFWILIIAGVVSLLVWFFRQGHPSETTPTPGGDRALETLRQRYASGEITKEQFDQMRRDLEGGSRG